MRFEIKWEDPVTHVAEEAGSWELNCVDEQLLTSVCTTSYSKMNHICTDIVLATYFTMLWHCKLYGKGTEAPRLCSETLERYSECKPFRTSPKHPWDETFFVFKMGPWSVAVVVRRVQWRPRPLPRPAIVLRWFYLFHLGGDRVSFLLVFYYAHVKYFQSGWSLHLGWIDWTMTGCLQWRHAGRRNNLYGTF